MGGLTAQRLRCEHAENPVGIGEAAPRFSWILATDGRDCIQASWRIQVDMHDDFRSPVWDSGVVDSPASVLVEYAGPALRSRTRYSWRVRVTDTKGRESGWSAPALFETALLDPAEWQADFIGPAGEEAGTSPGLRLRREFRLDPGIVRARIYSSALGLYELRANGSRVGDALFTPGWTAYHKRLLYQTWDVTGLLHPGANAVGATLGAGWYKGDLAGWVGGRNVWGARTAIILQLHVDYADGRAEVIGTDESWTCSDGPIVYSELYHGEIYDARREEPGWDRPGFDARRWKGAERVAGDRSLLVAQDGPLVRRQEELRPVGLFTTPRGERVLDFGQNLAGWVRFSVAGRAGDKVTLRHAEVLDAGGNFYTANLRSARARIEYTLRGGEQETFEPHFTFQGFRYVSIDEIPGEPRAEDFTAVVIHSDMPETGTFACSHPLLNALHHNIAWSLKGNFLDIPTDCPQRDERLGWTGDAQVFISTACFLRDAAGFFSRWLRDLAAEQREDGGVPFVVPDVLSRVSRKDSMMGSTHSSCGWGDAAVICPWTLYLCSGDRRVLERQYSSMKAWVEHIRAHARDGLLWDTGFHFGDWVALDAQPGSYFGATPSELTATAFYAYSTSLLARAAGVLGRAPDARGYEDLHHRIVQAFRREFFTPSGRLAARTQTAHVLALVFDLVPGEHRERCVNDLVDLIRKNGGHLTTGFLGTPFICRALSDNGGLEEAYALLLKDDYPSWLYQVTRGATTVWEHWDGIKPDGSMWSEAMNSFNHYASGAVGAWLHEVVGGLVVSADAPGYKSFVVHPRPGGGITWAKTSLQTPYGRASVSWRQDNGKMHVDIEIPHNSSARVILPGARPSRIEGERAGFTARADGAEAPLGSGTWSFAYPVSDAPQLS